MNAYNAVVADCKMLDNRTLEPNEVIILNGCITQAIYSNDIDPCSNKTGLRFGIDALIHLACKKIRIYRPLDTVNDNMLYTLFDTRDNNKIKWSWMCPVITHDHMEMYGWLRSDGAYVTGNTTVYAFLTNEYKCPSYRIVRCEPPADETPHRKLYDLAIEYKMKFGYDMTPRPESKELMQAYNALVPNLTYRN